MSAALQRIFLGTSVNDDTGDTAYIGGAKINSNFSYLLSLTGAATLALSGLQGMVQALSLTSGGAGYATSGTYNNVPLYYKNAPQNVPGAAATANITVSGGVVTAVTPNFFGTQYQAGDVLTTPNFYLGGSGANFSCTVGSVVSIDPTGVADSHAAVQLAINYAAANNIVLSWDCKIYCQIGTSGSATSAPYANTIFTPMNSTTMIDFTSAGLLITDNVATPALCCYHSNLILNRPVASYIESTSGSAGSILATYNAGQITSTSVTAGGTGYLPATGSQVYSNVPVIGGTGNNGFVNVTVTAGVVTAVAVATGGAGNSYVAGDTFTVTNTFIGGSGSGFTASVGSVNNTQTTCNAAINNWNNFTLRAFAQAGYVSGVTGNSFSSGVNPAFNGITLGSSLIAALGSSSLKIYGGFRVAVPAGVPADQYLPAVVTSGIAWAPGTSITSNSTPQNNATCTQPSVYCEGPSFDGYVMGFSGSPKYLTIKDGEFFRYADIQNSAANDPYALQPGGNGNVFPPPHAIYCVSHCNPYTITGITSSGSNTVISFTDSGDSTNPMYVGMTIGLAGIVGMTQLNEQFGVVTAISGTEPNYTCTVSINSSNYSSYVSGGSIIAGVFCESHVSDTIDHGNYGGWSTRRSISSGVVISYKAELAENNVWTNVTSKRPDGGFQFIGYGLGQGRMSGLASTLDTTTGYCQNAGSTPAASSGANFATGTLGVANGHITDLIITDTAPNPAGWPLTLDQAAVNDGWVLEAEVDAQDYPETVTPITSLSGWANTSPYPANGPGTGTGGGNFRMKLIANFGNCTNTTTQYRSIVYMGGGTSDGSVIDVVLNGWRPISSYLAALRNRIVIGGSFSTPSNAIVNVYDSANNHRQEVAAGRNRETWTQSQVCTMTASGSFTTSIVIPAGYSVIDYSWFVGGTALGQNGNLGYSGSTTAIASGLSGSANANPLIGAFSPILFASQETLVITAPSGNYTAGAQVYLSVTCQANWSVGP